MHAYTLRGLGGALLAVVAFATVCVLPGTLSSSWHLPQEPEPHLVVEAPRAPARSGHAAFVQSVNDLLARRMRSIAVEDRGRIARTIVAEAESARLDPVLVLALIGVESSFDHKAESLAGALGLMQLRPSTLWHEAERSRLEGTDPTDPVLNVRAGVRYYRRLLSAFRSHELALMAYNAGPSRIRGYLEAGEVPERFYDYPRKVREELRRLRTLVAAAPFATAAEPL